MKIDYDQRRASGTQPFRAHPQKNYGVRDRRGDTYRSMLINVEGDGDLRRCPLYTVQSNIKNDHS